MRNRPLPAALQALSSWSRFGAGAVIAVLVVCGIFGREFVKPFVGWLGGVVGHDELVLRALGWAWLGVPLVVFASLVLLRERVAPGPRKVLGLTVFALAASSTMLPGGRGDSPEKVFGEVYPDAQPLAYGWAGAGLSIFAMLFVSAAVLLIADKIAGSPLPASARKPVGRAIGGLCVALLVGGLWIALTGPLPT